MELKMDYAKQNWPILQRLPANFVDRVRSFMVIGMEGDGVLLQTKNGEGYWFGRMKFGWNDNSESREVSIPTRLDVSNVAVMAHGRNHIVLLCKGGGLYTLGLNNCHQLGRIDTDIQDKFSANFIGKLGKFIDVRCGCVHNLTLTEDNKVFAWGGNDCGQLGIVSPTTSTNPFLRPVSQLDAHSIVAIECGGQHSLALTDKGEVYAWGWNRYGQIGLRDTGDKNNNDKDKNNKNNKDKNNKNNNNKKISIPTRMNTPCPIKSMAAGHSHTLLLTENAEVYACGRNEFGQLGFKPASKDSTASLSIVAKLPPILQIGSHFDTHLSVALSTAGECFVWGKLANEVSLFVPLKLPSIYSTIDSAISFRNFPRNTPHSVPVQALTDLPKTHSTDPKLANRMLDNPDSNPDVQFLVGDKKILAHRWVLKTFSEHFMKIFSENKLKQDVDSANPVPSSPSNSTKSVETNSSMVSITITPYSYSVYYAYLSFLYSGVLNVSDQNIIEFFELSVANQEFIIQQLCLKWMRSTMTVQNCCLFYQVADLHSLSVFCQEVLQFISTKLLEVFATSAYQSMSGDLCKKLAISIVNIKKTNTTPFNIPQFNFDFKLKPKI